MTSTTDENSQVWSTGYTDPNYWRPTSTTDPASATTDLYYYTGPFATESTLNFNGSTSTIDTRTTEDGLGRTHVSQRRQTQGGTNYDSVETDYNALGEPYEITVPYTGTAGQTNSSAARTTTYYDAMGRPTQVTDADGDSTYYNYTQTPGSSPVGFDVLVTIGVSGGQLFKRQMEYDGVGRLTSVCELTSASGVGAGTCAQSVSATGFWTKYTYDPLNDLLTVKQNAQSSTYQTRTYAYDGLARMTSAQNPEANGSAYTYTLDTDPTCGTHDGDLVKRIDPQGTVTCYAYDAMHRLTSVTYPSGGYSSVTPAKYYVYDSATVDSVAMSYAKSRLAEAYTGTSKTTDLGFSYSNRGEVAGVYQSSPHSSGYYHLSATYWASQGLFDTLNPNMSGAPTWTYGPDGEGRVNTVSASAGVNPVTATSYNGFSEATAITYGSGDSDAFQYDPYTGRMTQYKATINGSSMYGNLTWSQNFTLNLLAITDPFNSANTQTCGYTYDDLARVNKVDCGTGNWGQSFSYIDNATNSIAAFGNISKSVLASHTGSSFAAAYSDTTNRLTTIGSTTVTYDSNGNVTYDGFHHYTWDAEGSLATLDSNPETYDALNRRVEQSSSGAYTEIVYSPASRKIALMNAQTVIKIFTPLSGGATAVYTSSGLQYYRHPDWLGSSRLASGANRTVYYDAAYAPYGEPYAETGTTDRDFTGQNQDLTPGSTGDLYDFPSREYHPTQGRWVSPDPAGLASVDRTNPQSWNRYAYVGGNPLSRIDPNGLFLVDCVWNGCPGSACYACGGPGFGGGGLIYVDGAPQTVFNTSGLGSNALAACPNNVCDGFTNSGQYFQFVAGAGGAQGYVLFSDIVQGLYEANGVFYSSSQWQAYLAATYASQIASQYNRISAYLSALFGDAASADPDDPDVIGGHANFDLTCTDMTVCGPGRYDFGIHVEYDAQGNLVVHDDTVSPWLSPFSMSNFNFFNFLEHGFVDLFGGTLCNCVFP
jgi:RHS repeat-associated protein